MNKRAAIYARVSLDIQRDNYSIPSQVDRCVRYAQEKGYSLVGDRFVDRENGQDVLTSEGAIPAYVDDYSSRELSRPGLDAALEYLRTVGYDALIVYTLDRLARDPYIRQTLEMEIESLGGKVEYATGDYEDSTEGEVRKDLDATFARWENAKRVERFNRGKCRKAEQGKFVTGITPYGYRRDDKALGGLAVDERQAAIVHRIFVMYANEGLSIRQIADRLNAEGLRSYRGPWAKTTLRRLLKNPVYIGTLFYNKTRCRRNGPETRNKDEWISIPTTPLVDEELFDAAQKRFKENLEYKRRSPKRFYLLTGMVFCEECGRPYVTQTYNIGKQRRTTEAQIYRHRKDKGHCVNRSLRAEQLETVVWKEIIVLLQDPLRLRKGYEESLEQQKLSHARQRSHLETLNKRRIKLEQSRQNLNAAYIDPDITMSKAEYVEQKQRIDDELKSIEAEVADIQKDLAYIPSPAELETLEAFSAEVCERLELVEMRSEDKRKIFELLHVKVFVSESGMVRIDGWFNAHESDGLSDRQWISWGSLTLLSKNRVNACTQPSKTPACPIPANA
jgi:site-specific DNA recombinase